MNHPNVIPPPEPAQHRCSGVGEHEGPEGTQTAVRGGQTRPEIEGEDDDTQGALLQP